MGTSILKKAAGFLRKKGKYAAVLACVLAVSAAGYRMVLPGFTLERELVCGLEEHVHTEACFPPPKDDANGGTEGTPENGKPEGDGQPGLDVGTESGMEKVLACPFEGKEAHAHGPECYETEKILICGREETETEGHIHTEDCYTIIRELSCGQEESSGHAHDASCYQAETRQTCSQEESSGHTHGDGCYDENDSLACGQEESSGHSHGEACYSSEDKLVCGQEEVAGHTHEDGCYTETKELTCGKEETGETEKHTHTDSCYQEDNKLVCGKEEYDPEMHVHGEGCYIEKPISGTGQDGTAGDVTQGEGNGAVGDGTQGGENQECQPICGLEEHTHTDACYGEEIMAIADNIVESGEGWQLNDEGLLTIAATDATGAMTAIPDYSSGGAPWYDYRGQIKAVKIEEGIERIGNYAFYRCEQLKAIEIPEGVREIGWNAFSWCGALSEVNLPDSLETIGLEAFRACANLMHMEIPDSVTEIGDGAFCDCTSLTRVKLPKDLKEIKVHTFWNNDKLTSINIPEGVAKIGRGAFADCASLVEITLPEGVKQIGKIAFRGTRLASIELPQGLESMYYDAFELCDNLSSLTIKARNLTVTLERGQSSAYFNYVRQVKVYCESVDTLREEVVGTWENVDVDFVGSGFFTTESPLPLGNPTRKVLAAGRYYADEQGALYLLHDGTASLAHVPAGITEYTVKGRIQPAEGESGQGWAVESVGKDALKMANGLESLWFEDTAAITALPDYSCANCPSLSSVNGERTVGGVRQLFPDAGVGPLAFYNTGLEGGEPPGLDNSKITIAVDGQTVLTMSTANPDGEAGGPLELYTGELAQTSLTMSNQLNSAGYKAARVYFSFESREGITQYGSAGSDITVKDDKGNSYTIRMRQSEDSLTYYYEIPWPGPGCTLILTGISSTYPSPSSGGGSVKIWPVLLTEEEMETVGNGVTGEGGRCHQASWGTEADTFAVTKGIYPQTSPAAKGDGKGSVYMNSLSYSIAMNREGDTLESIGKDYMRSAEFEDTLLLPEGMEWRPELLEAVEASSAYWSSKKNNYTYIKEYYANTGGTPCLLFRIESYNPVIIPKEPAMEEEDGRKALKIRWSIENGSTGAEIDVEGDWKLTFGDEAILVNPEDTPDDGEGQGKGWHIVNQVEATQHFTYSGDEVKKALVGTDVQATEGGCKVSKTSNGKRNMTWGDSYEYAISLENEGIFPYTGLYSVQDMLSKYLYIKPADMEKMVQEAEGADGVARLEISIIDAALCKAGPADGQGYYPGKQVTGTDGKAYTLTWQDTGIGTGYEAGKDTGTDPDLEDLAQLAILWERGKDGVVLSYPDGTKTVTDMGDLGRELESIGYMVTAHTQYKATWGMEEGYRLESGKGPELHIPVTVKDSFMLLLQDVLEMYGKSGLSLEMNMAVAATAEGDKENVYYHPSSSSTVYRDYTLNKRVGKNGSAMDTGKDTVVAEDVLNYTLQVGHRASPMRGIVPLVDRMRGAQVLLVPTAGNGILEGRTLEKKEVGGEEYYLLAQEGVYQGVTLGGCLTESITVTKGEGGELDTMIRWYLADIQGTGTRELKYNAYVVPSQGGNDGTFRLSNESWLNDHQSHRLYAPVGVTGTNAVIDKKIVLSQGAGREPKDDELAEYSPVHEGSNTTYRLMITNMGQGRTIAGSQIYDALPEAWGFRWSKENVKVEYYDAGDGSYRQEGSYDAGDGAYRLLNAENWEIEDVTEGGRQKQRIVWGEDFRLDLEKTIYIYVTLEWPEGETWEKYAIQYGAKRLENTFWCYQLWSRVTHDLAAGTKAYLQKGVYYSGTKEKLKDDEENRFYYANSDAVVTTNENLVVYYTCIYNGGNTRLYLNELQDRMPKGFTVNKSAVSGNKLFVDPPVITDANGNRVAFQHKNVYGSIKKLGDGRISISLRGEEGNKSYIQYDDLLGKWYLAPGEAVCFTYKCEPGKYADTEDLAVNCIAMPYDMAGELEVADVKAEGPDCLTNETAMKNDGSCSLMDTEGAGEKGFTGGEADTQWLASEVTVRRGEITPGITKKAASVTALGQTKPYAGSAYAGDTINWEVVATNSGREPIVGYTLTDTMEMPYGFTGPVVYKMERPSNTGYSTSYTDELFRVNSCTKEDGKVSLNLRVQKLDFYDIVQLDGKMVNGEVITFREGSVLSVSRQRTTSGSKKLLEYDICLSSGSGGEIELMVHCKSSDMAIPPGGRGTLTLSTKNITNEYHNKIYLNKCYITPETQQYDGDLVSQGNQTVHNGKPSVQNSARVQVASSFTTSSEKRVEEVRGDGIQNMASSNGEKNYILLQDAGRKFRYTLAVDNTEKNDTAMSRLVLIDSLPQVGDHNPFSEKEPRFSAFRVDLAEDPGFEVWVRRKGEAPMLLDQSQYRLEYSSGTKFGTGDWAGEDTGIWHSDMGNAAEDRAGVRSFRIVIQDGDGGEALIPAGASIEVQFTAQTAPRNSGEAPVPGGTAWNSFGYRCTLDAVGGEVESAPLNVGVRMPDVPRLIKELEDGEGRPAPAAEDMSFRFLIYQGDRLPLKEGFTEEELAEALDKYGRGFTCVETEVKSGQSQSERLVLDGLKKWEAQSGGWTPTEEDWIWEEKGKYTVVELPPGEEGLYQFAALGGLAHNGYTFTHSEERGKKIVAVNARENPEGYGLPETGGMGSHGYTLAGCLCLTAAGLAFGRKKRKGGGEQE